MPTPIGSLQRVTIDFTNRGPGLAQGLQQASNLLNANRTGHLVLDVRIAGGSVPVVMDRASLYILGFQCNTGWRRFSDAYWPFIDEVTSLGHDGTYASLGELDGVLTLGSIDGMSKLLEARHEPQWRPSLLTLVVVVAENLRLIPVRMRVLGLLNGFQQSVPLLELRYYIKNWAQASAGKDMSVETGPNFRTGFRDPTLIKR